MGVNYVGKCLGTPISACLFYLCWGVLFYVPPIIPKLYLCRGRLIVLAAPLFYLISLPGGAIGAPFHYSILLLIYIYAGFKKIVKSHSNIYYSVFVVICSNVLVAILNKSLIFF
jgi:hypothetical protein